MAESNSNIPKFEFYLNRQGLRGRTGEKGEAGFAPIVEIGQNTANTFTLIITTETGSFETPNLRGSIINNAGQGTFLRYNQEEDKIYLSDLPEASFDDVGGVTKATEDEIKEGTGSGVVTASDLGEGIFGRLEAGENIKLEYNEDEDKIVITADVSGSESGVTNITGIKPINVETNEDDSVTISIDDVYMEKFDVATPLKLTKSKNTMNYGCVDNTSYYSTTTVFNNLEYDKINSSPIQLRSAASVSSGNYMPEQFIEIPFRLGDTLNCLSNGSAAGYGYVLLCNKLGDNKYMPLFSVVGYVHNSVSSYTDSAYMNVNKVHAEVVDGRNFNIVTDSSLGSLTYGKLTEWGSTNGLILATGTDMTFKAMCSYLFQCTKSGAFDETSKLVNCALIIPPYHPDSKYPAGLKLADSVWVSNTKPNEPIYSGVYHTELATASNSKMISISALPQALSSAGQPDISVDRTIDGTLLSLLIDDDTLGYTPDGKLTALNSGGGSLPELEDPIKISEDGKLTVGIDNVLLGTDQDGNLTLTDDVLTTENISRKILQGDNVTVKQVNGAVEISADKQEVEISPDPNNALSKKADGLFVEKASGTTSYAQLDNTPKLNGHELTENMMTVTTQSVDVTFNGTGLSADVKVSDDGNNALTIKNDGLFVDKVETKGIEVSPDANNILEDRSNGLYVPKTTIPDVTYSGLQDKPSINGVELSGNKTTEDLNIKSGVTDYEELTNIPTLDGLDVKGAIKSDKTTDVEITFDGEMLGGNIKVSEASGNGLVKQDDGLYADKVPSASSPLNIADEYVSPNHNLQYINGAYQKSKAITAYLTINCNTAEDAQNQLIPEFLEFPFKWGDSLSFIGHKGTIKGTLYLAQKISDGKYNMKYILNTQLLTSQEKSLFKITGSSVNDKTVTFTTSNVGSSVYSNVSSDMDFGSVVITGKDGSVTLCNSGVATSGGFGYKCSINVSPEEQAVINTIILMPQNTTYSTQDPQTGAIRERGLTSGSISGLKNTNFTTQPTLTKALFEEIQTSEPYLSLQRSYIGNVLKLNYNESLGLDDSGKLGLAHNLKIAQPMTIQEYTDLQNKDENTLYLVEKELEPEKANADLSNISDDTSSTAFDGVISGTTKELANGSTYPVGSAASHTYNLDFIPNDGHDYMILVQFQLTPPSGTAFQAQISTSGYISSQSICKGQVQASNSGAVFLGWLPINTARTLTVQSQTYTTNSFGTYILRVYKYRRIGTNK